MRRLSATSPIVRSFSWVMIIVLIVGDDKATGDPLELVHGPLFLIN